MKRSIKIKSIDGNEIVELVLSRVVEINTEVQMIHFDQMKDGTWRMTYNKNTIPDIKAVQSFELTREN